MAQSLSSKALPHVDPTCIPATDSQDEQARLRHAWQTRNHLATRSYNNFLAARAKALTLMACSAAIAAMRTTALSPEHHAQWLFFHQ
ncbi:hypothetical protein DFH07DRAFT_949232 [Mycena maculata]|uniref:Uncharacterized protein n=1 Tax=Mycena maculata TaxID=230809 RepID=A0AAD7KBW9_9AGAR|nr:hypothetical protein DFH07DRAFT_949232 [Mycena maculata]